MTYNDSFSERILSFGQNGRPAGELARGALAVSGSKVPEKISVLFASPEVFPLAKTGGLADVSAALPATLSELGVDVRVAMPGYTEALDLAEGKQKAIPLGDIQGLGEAAVIMARTPDTGVPLLLVDCPALSADAVGFMATPRAGTGPTTRCALAYSPTSLRGSHSAKPVSSGVRTSCM